ncbi:hypothetical protein MSG28_005153 [Choristoneura fumiferana]|uniref:Uncharacterized protein n=1 Tax=Choristoneura fumiferana TaxID=7141 RepID=A0ACC0JQ90_CHOFU|nr:hypothetical protein MSG28_005153 [Choristoneura fumiferana]
MIPTIATTMDNQTERNEYGAYFAPLRTKSLRTSSNLLILQLAIFDFIMMAKAPIFIYNSAMKGFAAGDIGCQIFALMGAYSGIGASMTNACIAFDRTKSLRTSSNLLILQLAIFDFIMMAKAPIFIYNSAMKGFAAGDIGCQIFALMGAYSGIGASMTNACIAFDREQAKKMNVESLRSNQQANAQSAEIRIAKAALTVCFLFVASWTPYGIMSLIGAFGDQQLLTPGLDEVEYALPASDAPTLAEVLSADDEGEEKIPFKPVEEPTSCSAVQVDFLQAVSQQIIQAQERSSAGAATALIVGSNGKTTVGTAHGHILSFHDQTLRWVCDSNTDCGAVSCLAYNQDSTRLLTGYARGLICQYDSIRGLVLRRVTLGGEIWGTLRVTWAGMSGLALDTGGSVWLIKFSRPLGVRSARSSCLFSGARGEVVAMAARDARVLALATLSRVIIVAGGRAAGVRLGGPPDTLPVLAWSDTDDRILVCGRAKTLQWLAVSVTGSSILLRPVHRVELKSSPLWLGWLGENLAIFDADENLRLWGDDYEKPLDLSHIEPVYASAFFKGLWTDGRVSRAMCMAGGSALGGACVAEGALSLLGRRGVVRVRPRDLLARAQASMSSGRHTQALRLLCSAQGSDAKALANSFIINISERPHLLSNKALADLAINDELWTCLWEQCAGEKIFVEALGEAAVRGELYEAAPSPDCSQELIERLASVDPSLVERVVASLPLTGAMRELVLYVDEACRGGAECACAGSALLLAAADALAGRGAAGRPLPPHAQPSARHDALHALLAPAVRGGRWRWGEWGGGGGARSPLLALAAHDARACVRLLEQSAREPPFAGPLGKQNRLRVARALLHLAPSLQLSAGALPGDRELLASAQQLAAATPGERADRAWLALLLRAPATPAVSLAPASPAVPLAPAPAPAPAPPPRRATASPRTATPPPPPRARACSGDSTIEADGSGARKQFEGHLAALVELRPSATAALVDDQLAEQVAALLRHSDSRRAHEFAECLLEAGKLRGEAATAFFRNLCISRPTDASDFLEKNPGVLRPEEALAIVRETGARDAEPACLEATGDPEAALDALLALTAAAAPEAAARLVRRACELCARVAPGVPAEAAAGMWARLLRRADAPPAALLLEAAAYLPSAQLAERVCGAPRVALGVLGAARGRRGAWACAARVAAREAHEALARALRAARRGLPVRGRCARCDAALAASGSACRTTHCARAVHAECGAGAACALCGARLPDAVLALPPLAPRPPHAAPQDHVLQLLHDLLVNLLKMEASNNTDAVNLGVGEVEAEIGEELKQLEEGKDYDTRSEVSSSTSSDSSTPSISSASSKSRRKIFMPPRSRLSSGSYKRRSPSPYMRERLPVWFTRGRDSYSSSSSAAAEAYVAEYMRSMHHQLPPLPYVPPPGFSGALAAYDGLPPPPPPPPPRYYDGPLADYPRSVGAMRELVLYVDEACRGGAECACAGSALLLAAADALAGRGAAGRPLPPHAQPSARHDALHARRAVAVGEWGGGGGARSPLLALAAHDARACVRLLEQSAREPPFAGPLGKQNRLRVARALLHLAPSLQCWRPARGPRAAGQRPAAGRRHARGARRPRLARATAARARHARRLARPRRPPSRSRPPLRPPPPPPPAPRDRLAAHRDAAAAATRPRVLWRLDVLLDNHNEALAQFFQIENPSDADIDELFEYLRSRIEADGSGARKQFEGHLAALVELRPSATAALVDDQLAEQVAALLRHSDSRRAHEFAECLLEAGKLRGEAATAFFRNLCISRPTDASDFLEKNPGVLRPEEALAIVRETGARDAEPACLEATGDPEAALDALLALTAAAAPEAAARLVRRACELCARVAPGVPAEAAAGMWARLLRRADAPPAALLLEAAAYLPSAQLAERVCGAPRVALGVLGAARGRRGAWACAARVAAREAHEALARALRAARRGLPVRGRCARCDAALAASGSACRTTHCARAVHAECGAGAACALCGARLPDAVLALPPLAPRPPHAAPQDHVLQLLHDLLVNLLKMEASNNTDAVNLGVGEVEAEIGEELKQLEEGKDYDTRSEVSSSTSSDSSTPSISSASSKSKRETHKSSRLNTSSRSRRKIFMPPRSRLSSGSYKRRSPSPYMRERLPVWFTRGRDSYSSSSSAAAEAYVAEYMRSMHHQLPPLPYVPPPGFSGALAAYDGLPPPPPPPPPRYYDGPLADYPRSVLWFIASRVAMQARKVMTLAALSALLWAASAAAAERGGGIKVGSGAAGGARGEGARGGGVRVGGEGCGARAPPPRRPRPARPLPSPPRSSCRTRPSAHGTTPKPRRQRSPTILDSLCKEFLAVNVSAILYLMNHEQYGRSTASAQYFLQLAGYLGIPDRFKFTILNAVVVKKPADLNELVTSEARVMLLYATREEAADILSTAGDLHLTSENFVWIVTQTTAVKVFAYGVDSYVSEPENALHPLGTRLSCSGAGAGEARWATGERFYRHLRNVSVDSEAGRPSIEFTPDGELRAAELKIMNLRPAIGEQLVWEEIGTWNSYPKERLDIKDIVWPGGLHTPPQGVPEKFHMRITFLEEPPYINLAPPDPISGRCSLDRGVICRVAPEVDVAGLEAGTAHRNSSLYQCCSGFCIDLLQQLAEQLGFTYELSRVEDGRWGTLHNSKWNGLIADLVNKRTDMVLTSLIINSDREAVVDFSVPFMETGVAIVVAKRTGIISPTAFLEPFDTASWMLVGAVAIQAATFSIFFFEWLSPSGYNRSTVSAGVSGVLTAELDAFIYDGTVLDYLVSQRLLDLRSNGDLERLRRYWMTGTCKPNKQEHKSSDPLALEQFLSAFLLLMAGILLAALLLLLEHVYFRYMRAHLAASTVGPCCALVSLSMVDWIALIESNLSQRMSFALPGTRSFGDMSKDILVLTPNGRRQKVHCTPDTSILQVLEDVCAKQGFRPTEYDLKHHNHVLDPTTTIRWSNLPNRATLEMRRTGEFPPNTSLFELANTLAPAELSSLTHPTILYMRQEVTGELALRNKTLRQLGLIGGRAVLRLLNKAEEGMQANVSAVYRRPLPAKDDKFLESHKEREHTYKETPSSGAPEKQQVQKKVHTETFDPIDLIKKEKGKKTQVKHEEEKTVQIRDSDDNLPTKEDVSMEVDNFEANVKSASSSTSCLSQENLERRLKIEEEVTFLGAQKAIAFIPEGSDEEMEDLPDTFYELTVEETSQMRLSAHKHVVVRVQFPDHIILQGIFSPDDTIEVVINFIKAHLQTPDKPFHIFTTPLKETLDPKITLLEAKFVPCVHMHFKWIQEEANAKYLKEEIYSKTTSSDAATQQYK